MAMSDRMWNFLTASTITLLALVIIYFPESENNKNELKQEQIVEKIKKPFPFSVPPNIFGRDNLGDNGYPVYMPPQLPPKIKEIVDQGWKQHGFNQYISDLISVRRRLYDHRSYECKVKHESYRKNLPATSVIIIFHNEAWSTLLRSVHSVLDRSPEHLIEEILLVDDYSDMDHLKQPLDDYFESFPKVKILRASKREGLIRSRIRGTLAAKSKTLTFLESHIECTYGWLEPLLDAIAKNPTKVVCPVIDVISDETFKYFYEKDTREIHIGSFTWHLIFKWQPVQEKDYLKRKHSTDPFESPTMSGGLFAIDKAFFMKLGMYDPDFDIWGAENLELSFKTWMCGGTLEILPCSHVGHVYRKRSPYKWDSNKQVLNKNMVRLAEVWMDEYANYFYALTGYEAKDYGDISARKKLRSDLKCKPFKWFMAKFYPNQFNITQSLSIGRMRNFAQDRKFCLFMTNEKGKFQLQILSCETFTEGQYFFLTKKGELRRDDLCLDYIRNRNTVLPFKCRGDQTNQLWTFYRNSNQIFHNKTTFCLAINPQTRQLSMDVCNATRPNQKWLFERPN